jgi:hypothetical protein
MRVKERERETERERIKNEIKRVFMIGTHQSFVDYWICGLVLIYLLACLFRRLMKQRKAFPIMLKNLAKLF